MHSASVVVTGAGSGIGKAIVEMLGKHSFKTIAITHNTSDAQRLSLLPHIDMAFARDLADEAQIESLPEHITGEVFSVINCAATTSAGPLPTLSLDVVSKTIQVNALAPLLIVQKLLPQMIPNSRIINISSGEAFLPTPINGAYCASKSALETISNVLRMELALHDIHVVTVVPSGTRTAIIEKKARQHDEQIKVAENAPYVAMIHARQHLTDKALMGDPPEKVANFVEKALLAEQPKPRYYVGGKARLPHLLSLLPIRWQRWVLKQQGILSNPA